MSTTATLEPTTADRAPQGSEKAGHAISFSQIVGFRLAKEEYGIDIMRIREIIQIGPITEVPHVPPYVRGLINLRGQVIPIIDLRKRFELPERTSDEAQRIIVVNVSGRTVGMIVDAVDQVLRIKPEDVEPPPTTGSAIDHTYITGLLKQGENLIILLDIEKLLKAEALGAIDKAKAEAPASVLGG